MQHAHAREATLLKNLRRRDARLISRTRAISHNLAVSRQLLERRILQPVLQFSQLEVDRTFYSAAAAGKTFRGTNVDDSDGLVVRHLRFQFFGRNHTDVWRLLRSSSSNTQNNSEQGRSYAQ